MAINITFGDFDTVCYSSQHNIIELIKHSVGISIEINNVQSDIEDIDKNINDMKQEIEEIKNTGGAGVDDLGNRLNNLVSRFNLLENDYNSFKASTQGFMDGASMDLTIIYRRIIALEEKVGV